MPVDVTSILAETLSHNRGPDPLNPDVRIPAKYGISAFLDGDTLNVEFTFLQGIAYCCMEWGCHLPFHDGIRWDSFRRKMKVLGVPAPPNLKLQLKCVVEDGTIIPNWSKPDPSRRGRYEYHAVPAYGYELTAQEADSASRSE
jgi:hypothetical protein